MGVEHLKKTQGALHYGLLVPGLGAFRAELGASVQLRPHQVVHARSALGSSCAHGRERTAVSQSTQRDTVASSICGSICVVTGWCSYTACSSRLDESRCHSLPTLILPLVLALTLAVSSFGHGLASPSSSPHPSRPLPTLHLHSCPRTRTLTLTLLHCARRCRLLGASVGAISSLCDAALRGQLACS